MKSRSRNIGNLKFRIALKLDRYIGSSAADVSVILRRDGIILNTNLATSRLHMILRLDALSNVKTGPCIILENFYT